MRAVRSTVLCIRSHDETCRQAVSAAGTLFLKSLRTTSMSVCPGKTCESRSVKELRVMSKAPSKAALVSLFDVCLTFNSFPPCQKGFLKDFLNQMGAMLVSKSILRKTEYCKNIYSIYLYKCSWFMKTMATYVVFFDDTQRHPQLVCWEQWSTQNRICQDWGM